MDTSSTFATLLDGIAGVSTLSLRLIVIYFTRWLPLGPRFLPTIYWSFALYATAVILKLLICKKSTKPVSRFQIILLGLFDSRRVVVSSWSVLVNVLALASALDFVYRAHVFSLGNDISFSRSGHIAAHDARVVVRAPHAGAVQIEYQPADEPIDWTVGPTYTASADNDYVVNFVLDALSPDTKYVYRTNASHIGSFQTPPSHPQQWTMVSASCIKPGFPYNPFLSALHIPGLIHLSTYTTAHPTSFMLFLGDFICIDLPKRFGFDNEDYRRAYRQVYASPSWTPELRSLPFIHTYDDHEFSNDWASNTTGLFSDAVEPYMNYHGVANPPPSSDDKSWYIFKHGDVSFFVADTRRYRSSHSISDGSEKTMLGPSQLSDLQDWLELPDEETVWKVFVTSVPFTKNWRGPEANDSWARIPLGTREDIVLDVES